MHFINYNCIKRARMLVILICKISKVLIKKISLYQLENNYTY